MCSRRHPHAYALLSAHFVITFSLAQTPTLAQEIPPPATAASTVLRTTVRRVVLDVTVTGPDGKPLTVLTKHDFTLTEDKAPQTILSFDKHGFEQGMDYTPPKLPPEPPNTFLNLPATPEKGPLYVLLYDLVNMDNLDQQNLTTNQHADQMRGRNELLKFIRNVPEGARIAIFVRSDGLHLIQGFTSDRAKLLAAIDPHHPGPHIPMVYLMGENMGSGDTRSGISTLGQIATYLDGLPGRKNLIWFSGTFPLAFFATASVNDSPDYVARLRRMVDLLARNQIAIYPVDVRGVVVQNGHQSLGLTQDGAAVTTGPAGGVAASNPGGASSGPGNGAGLSLLSGSYNAEEEIAKETGGHAFYSNNDVAGLLQKATETGASFYTLTYNPTNRDYDGKIRNIKVTINRKDCTLAYRQFYYGDPNPTYGDPKHRSAYTLTSVDDADAPVRPPNDSLSANMQHGAPIAHQLLFGITVHVDGAPALGTPKQMAALDTNADQFRPRKGKPLTPVPLQRYTLDFGIFPNQFKPLNASLKLEIAVAAFNADGEMLNATVSVATRTLAESTDASFSPAKLFRAEQQLDVPTTAAYLRFAVRDTNTDRIGATEIQLPLTPEHPTDSAGH